MKIHRAAAFAAKIGVHKNTVKAWSLKGQLPDRRTPAGHRHCTDADRFFGVERALESGHNVVYCCVSRRVPPGARGRSAVATAGDGDVLPGAGLAVDEWPAEIGGDLCSVR